MVRRHDGLGAAGFDTLLREAEQRRQHLHGAVQQQSSVQQCTCGGKLPEPSGLAGLLAADVWPCGQPAHRTM